LQFFYTASQYSLRQFYALLLYLVIDDMNATYLRSREISLALLVTAVLEARPTAGDSDLRKPSSSRLLPLGHALTHNTSRKRLPRVG
jgi:hypothetical protein